MYVIICIIMLVINLALILKLINEIGPNSNSSEDAIAIFGSVLITVFALLHCYIFSFIMVYIVYKRKTVPLFKKIVAWFKKVF